MSDLEDLIALQEQEKALREQEKALIQSMVQAGELTELVSPFPTAPPTGTFEIGLSPVGEGSRFNVWDTIISQYGNSPTLTRLAWNWQLYIDQTYNMQEFFDKIWNIDTAVGIGLDIWGRILAINRVLKIGVGPRYFGFNIESESQPAQDYEPFGPGGVGPFYSGQKLIGNYALSDDGFRVMLLAKAFSNICDGSISAINRLLTMLFGASGVSYVRDNLNMTMDYYFKFQPSAVQYAILTQSGVFPRPTGVSYTVVVSP